MVTQHCWCAGLWRVLTPNEAVAIVARFYGVHENGYDEGEGDATAAARSLVNLLEWCRVPNILVL